MASYSIAETRNNLTKLLNRVEAGEEVSITRRGKPIAKLVPERQAAMGIDLEWLERVRVHPKDTALDFTEIVRQMRDEGY
jgi:prevent-host-death family protein